MEWNAGWMQNHVSRMIATIWSRAARSSLGAIVGILIWGAVPTPAFAQSCGPGWLPSGQGVTGVDGTVYACVIWDPDGAGPQTAKFVVGGTFTTAGRVAAANVSMFDPQTGVWSALGSGVNDRITALATLPNGKLIAAGRFTVAGGVAARSIASWDGSTWSALGSGMNPNADVRALAVLPNGDLIAGGFFTSAGGAAANYIAR